MAVFRSGELVFMSENCSSFSDRRPAVGPKFLYKFRTKRAYRARNRAPSGFISSQQYRLNCTLFSWPWEAGRALHRAKVLELSEDHWFGNQVALEALVRFSDEELKHQALFRLCPSSNALRQFATLLSGGSSSSVRLN